MLKHTIAAILLIASAHAGSIDVEFEIDGVTTECGLVEYTYEITEPRKMLIRCADFIFADSFE